MNPLLHPENFSRIRVNGRRIKKWFQKRALQILEDSASIPEPNISVVIRTRNDADHIERLFADIKAQDYSGAVEIIVVDTESRDNTVDYARSHGAKIISLTQAEFNYPKALNMGFETARYPWVVTLVGHSSLTSTVMFKSLAYWAVKYNDLGGIYSLPLANWNASAWERLENIIAPRIWKRPQHIKELSIGIMAANGSIVKRETWQQLGGYDERYAAGGEDRALARSMLDKGVVIVREPLCSVFHSHGLNFKNTVKQWIHWGDVAKNPSTFNTQKVHSRRPDLR